MPITVGNHSRGTTPNRKTTVSIDTSQSMATELGTWQVRQMEKIARSGGWEGQRLTFNKALGWTLTPYQTSLSDLHELGLADSGIQTVASGKLTVPSKFVEANRQRWDSDLTGIPQGSLTISGDPFVEKTVAAGDNWGTDITYKLSADQTSFPSPTTTGANVPMDRVAVSSTNHAPWEPITLRYIITQTGTNSIGAVWTYYFCGPAGRLSNRGTGRYALSFLGDGRFLLEELDNTNTWRERKRFKVGSTMSGALIAGQLTITSDGFLSADGKWHGTRIVFRGQQDTGITAFTVNLGVGLPEIDPWSEVYDVPGSNTEPVSLEPVRLDIRRNVRMSFQISKARFPATGTLIMDRMELPYYPSGGTSATPLRVEWFGLFPTGTSITAAVYDEDAGGFLTATGAATTIAGYGGYQSFYPAQGHKAFHIELTFNADSQGIYSPMLQRVHALRDDTAVDYAPTEVPLSNIEVVSITGQDADPTHASAKIVVADLKSEFNTSLRRRSRMPIRVRTQYDPADPTKKTVLFQGYVARARRTRKGVTRKQGGFHNSTASDVTSLYPASDWGKYEITAFGEWTRLQKIQTPRSWDFSFDPTRPYVNGSPQQYKVTDAIRIMFLLAGYNENQLDIADLPMPLFSDGQTQLFLESNTPVGPTIVRWACEYLGGYLIFDPNAGAVDLPDRQATNGMWRLKLPPRPARTGAYNVLCEFLDKPNTSGSLVAATDPAAYSSTTGSAPYTSQTVLRTFMRYGTYQDDVIPPEANLIYVTGVGLPAGFQANFALLSAGLSQTKEVQMTAAAVNWKSATFFTGQGAGADTHPTADNTHPDFMGDIWPYYYSDPHLTTQAAVNFACRRIYDMAAHAQKWVWFEAPLVLVTDATDTLQVRPRPLQFGDVVKVKDATFIVNSVTIKYAGASGGDRFQHAVYELFSPPVLQSYATLGDNYPTVASALGAGVMSA